MTDQTGNSEAAIGWGTSMKLANAAGQLTVLDEVTDIKLPEEEAADVDVTHYKSPGRRKEYRQGLIDPGTGSLTLNYLPGSDTDILLRAAQNDGKVRAYEVVVPDETGTGAWKVSGFLYVKNRSRAIPVGDRMTMTVAVRFTGNSAEAAVAA